MAPQQVPPVGADVTALMLGVGEDVTALMPGVGEDVTALMGGAAPATDEQAFRQWYATKARQYNLNPDPDDPQQFYDYRAAFKSGASPDETGHWPSQFKKSGHPAMTVGGFNVQTGERVPGTPRVDEAELVRLGWDPATAKRLAAVPEEAAQPSMWERVKDMLTTPQAPEITSPAREQHPWATAAYERFVRPMSSIVGGAITGLTTAVGGPLIQAFPKAAGAGLTGLGAAGGAQLPGDIADVAREGFTPENTMALLEHGTMAAAAVPGVAMARGKLGGRPKAPAVKPAAVPAVGDDVTAVMSQGKMTLPPKGMEYDEYGVLQPIKPTPKPRITAQEFLRLKAEQDAARASEPLPLPPMAERPSTRTIERTAKAVGAPITPARAIQPHDVVKESMFKNFPEDQRKNLMALLEENGGFTAQRRDVQPVARSKELSHYIVAERTKVMPKGTIVNPEETVAIHDALTTVNDKVGRLSAQLNKGELGEWGQLDLLKAQKEQAILAQNWYGVRAEQGRALNLHKQMGQILASRDDVALQKALSIPEIRKMKDFADQWAKLTTPQEKLDFIRANQPKMTALDKVVAYRYANILSGVRTSLRNIIGSSSNAAFRVASSVPAIGYDMAKSTLTGKPRSIFLGEFDEGLARSAVVGLKEGWKDMLFTLKHGYNPSNLETFDVPRMELGGGGKNPFNWPGRFLEGQDQFMAGPLAKMNLYRRMYAKARGEGLRGEALDNRMVELALSPPMSLVEAAGQETQRMLFREDPGSFVKALLQLKQSDSKSVKFLASMIVPFVKIPGNIMRQSTEWLPGGALVTQQGRAALAAGGREQAEVVGRMVSGTTALGILGYWASQGKISGTGPRDPEQRAALMEQGWKPNSIKIPFSAIGGKDAWVDYQILLQPLAGPLAAVGNAWEQFHRTDEIPDWTMLVAQLGGSALDQSFFAGLSDLNAALGDPERSGKKFLHGLAQSLVPYSGLARNITQTVDPVVRDPKTMGEAAKSLVPGLSAGVEPRLTRFGEPAIRPGGPLTRGFSPVTASPVSQDPVVQGLARLKIDNIGLPRKDLPATRLYPAIKLTTDERQRVGKEVRKELEALFSQAWFQQYDGDDARKEVANVVNDARNRVYKQIREEREQLSRR